MTIAGSEPARIHHLDNTVGNDSASSANGPREEEKKKEDLK
jgi:hypothetical protein